MKKSNDKIKLPKHGYINKLANICRCSRHTVRRALFDNATGKKAEIVRLEYNKIYQ